MTGGSDIAVGPDEDWAAGRLLAEDLRGRAADVVNGAVERLRSEFTDGTDAVADDAGAGVAETLALILLVLAERRRPTTAEIDAVAGPTAALLARHGMPVEALLHRYRIVSNEVWRCVADAASGATFPQSTLLEAARLTWDATELLLVQAARAHRLAELELQRQHEEERRSFLRALLLGSISAEDLHRRAIQFGLDSEAPVVPFRARTLGAMPLHALESAILQAATPDRRGLTALLEGTLLGLLPAVPELEGLEAAVGLGPPARLADAKASFLHATRALDTAVAFGLRGVFRVEDLPLRALVASEPHIGDSLVERYLVPLDGMGQFGPNVERTLREFFERGMRVEETARALEVHPNTLRHRLRRFEEVTGTDLSRTEELFRIWWALERRGLLRATSAPGAATR